MGVVTDGSAYGIAANIVYSFPVTIKDKTWKIVPDLSISDFAREKMDFTAQELVGERELATTFLSQL